MRSMRSAVCYALFFHTSQPLLRTPWPSYIPSSGVSSAVLALHPVRPHSSRHARTPPAIARPPPMRPRPRPHLPHAVRPILRLDQASGVPVELRKHHHAGRGERDADLRDIHIHTGRADLSLRTYQAQLRSHAVARACHPAQQDAAQSSRPTFHWAFTGTRRTHTFCSACPTRPAPPRPARRGSPPPR